jgi:hypothetical protein
MLSEPDLLWSASARQFFAYWDSLPKVDFVPDRQDFSPSRIATLMPAVTILEVVSEDIILQRLTGTAVCRSLGFDPTGRSVADLMSPLLWPDYREMISLQLSVPCGRQNMLRSRRANLVDRAEVLVLPLRHARSGHWMLLSYFDELAPVGYDPGPYEILGYEETRWIDIGAGVPEASGRK